MPAARSWKRLAAYAAALVTALGTVLALAVATPMVAQAATAPPYWPQSPFNVPSGTGVNLPFTEYEAENASNTGKLIGPDFTQADLATEASGREAVQLTASGQYVRFTLTSAANAFDVHYALPQGASGIPQWLQVDLGSATSVSRIVLDLPPSTAWATRTQTITVQGSADGSNYTTLAASAGYTFNPATGNTATITFTASSVRYLKLTFTANTGWPAGQLSELQAFAS